jgi:hypothetical protein
MPSMSCSRADDLFYAFDVLGGFQFPFVSLSVTGCEFPRLASWRRFLSPTARAQLMPGGILRFAY